MTQTEINELKKGDKSILLDTCQFINIQHSDSSSVVNITWQHESHELRINKTNKKDFITAHKLVDLKDKDILILNPNNEGHERIYKIETDINSKKIKLTELHDMSQYSLTISIADSQ